LEQAWCRDDHFDETHVQALREKYAVAQVEAYMIPTITIAEILAGYPVSRRTICRWIRGCKLVPVPHPDDPTRHNPLLFDRREVERLVDLKVSRPQERSRRNKKTAK